MVFRRNYSVETEDADMENPAGASSPSRVSINQPQKNQSLVTSSGGGGTWRQIEVRSRWMIYLPPAKNQFLVTSSGEGGTWRQIEVMSLRWVIYLPPAKKPVSSDVIRRGGAQGYTILVR
jgi:hypothetical protein